MIEGLFFFDFSIAKRIKNGREVLLLFFSWTGLG